MNFKLVKFLVEKGGGITVEKDQNGKNCLHTLAEQCLNEKDITPFLTVLGAQVSNSGASYAAGLGYCLMLYQGQRL